MNRGFSNPDALSELAIKYRTARYELLAVVIFTLVNVLMPVFGSQTYFLFSIYFPYELSITAAVLCMRFPEEVYEAAGVSMEDIWTSYGLTFAEMEGVLNVIFAIVICVALAITGLYFLCFILSKKNHIWLVVGTVLFGIDTLMLLSNIDIISLVLHIIILVILIRGCKTGAELKRAQAEAAYMQQMMGQEQMMQQNGSAPQYEADFKSYTTDEQSYFEDGQSSENDQSSDS